MGAKDNFNQAMHEIFPFYKNAKTTETDVEEEVETITADIVEQTGTEPIMLRTFKASSPQGVEPIFTPKEQVNIETTYITKETKITGMIVSMSNLDISGEVSGDIESQHSIIISGKVEGNISGKDVEISSAMIKGNIHASQRLCITNKSLVVGNISANELEINSRLNGNINVKKEVTILSESNIIGDISATSIGIQKGAAIKGVVTTLSDATDDSY